MWPKKYKKAVLVHRTPREAKAVCPSDWMRKFNYSLSHPVKVSEEANRKWVVSGRWSIVTINPLPCTVSEIWLVTGRKKVVFLPHPSSPPNLTKLPIEFSDIVRIAKSGKDYGINPWELLSDYLNVCDHNPATLQIDRQTNRQTGGRADGQTKS